MEPELDTLDEVERLKAGLVARAVGQGGIDYTEYLRIRKKLVADERIKHLLPKVVLIHRSPDEFWHFIKPKFATYRERRLYLQEEFDPLLTFLEGRATSPADTGIDEVLSIVDSDHIHLAWQKALARRESDPDGAVTAARTLLETVIKHILDDCGVEYTTSTDLPKLYHLVAEKLRLAPAQHSEQVFKQILGGCKSVVHGLGELRNKHSDAHGKSKTAVKPAPRHASLAVNLAGTMATFLVETWESPK